MFSIFSHSILLSPSLPSLSLSLPLPPSLSLSRANKIYDKLQADHASEVAVTKANVKKMTVHIASLEGQLQQKVLSYWAVKRVGSTGGVFRTTIIYFIKEQEKQELAQICEDLMKELGNK